MIYRGVINETRDDAALGTLYSDQGEERVVIFPIPNPKEVNFNIKNNVKVTLFDGDDAKHEDGTVTPVAILVNRDKALILQLKEGEGTAMDVISGTIVDADMLVEGTL